MTTMIGTAGWAVPPGAAAEFGLGASSLERYATRFKGAEINSSFHRSHRASTWLRWAATVPEDFRFSVKVPKTITHKQKLVDCSDLLAGFLEEVGPLGNKLAVILVQLPPSLGLDPLLAADFFDALVPRTSAAIVCEPRHPSWFAPEADELLKDRRVSRVAADPACVPSAALPGGHPGLAYIRLHGSPRAYFSSYDDVRIHAYARMIRSLEDEGRDCWCIFDNTASGAAAGNALALLELLAA